MFWMKLLAIAASVFLIWYLYRFASQQPQMFSRANLGQTLYVLGWVALFLIVVVGMAVFSLRGA